MNCIKCFETKGELNYVDEIGFCTRCGKDYTTDTIPLVYLTSGCCEATETFEAYSELLKLPEFPETYPLNETEQKFIAEDTLETKNGGNLILGYSAYFMKQRWFAPTAEYAWWDEKWNDQELALKAMEADATAITDGLEASGGLVLRQNNAGYEDEDRHCLVLLIPIEYVLKTFKDYTEYKSWLQTFC